MLLALSNSNAAGGAVITTPTYRPVIGISVTIPGVDLVLSALTMRRDVVFCFNAEIQQTETLTASAASMFGKEIDVYFGILSPYQSIRTWVPTGVQYSTQGLKDGIRPYVQKYVANKGFFSGELKDETNCHRFTNDDPSGLHSIFVWIVKGGQSIGDPKNWIGAATSPLMLLD